MIRLLFACQYSIADNICLGMNRCNFFGKTPISKRFSIFFLQIFFESNEFNCSNFWNCFLRGFVSDLINFFEEKSRETDVWKKLKFWSKFQISFCNYLKLRKKKWVMVFMSFERRIVMSYNKLSSHIVSAASGAAGRKKS